MHHICDPRRGDSQNRIQYCTKQCLKYRNINSFWWYFHSCYQTSFSVQCNETGPTWIHFRMQNIKSYNLFFCKYGRASRKRTHNCLVCNQSSDTMNIRNKIRVFSRISVAASIIADVRLLRKKFVNRLFFFSLFIWSYLKKS